ncbi:MAG: leader peptidase (prepilin peptidase) / N-methyltransferase [Thermoleophilaceae bacterium]|jgi:leader peptidase (prepilin peptidase)/N-methyltransferase|nr:leader peptidase (prepilin peptidase) / N-methyltransferase [Thermoleophilaceae bacterium]
MVAEIAAAAVLGALIGSFLNVVIYRLPRGGSLLTPGSHCPSCDAPVRAFDNVPVLSWLLLRGRCRSCAAPISPRYPAVELLTAVCFAAVVAVRGFDEGLWLELPFVASLIALAGVDLDHKLLPNRIVYPMAVYGLVASALVDTGDLPEHLIAGAGAFLFLLVAVLAYPSGMGMGDVKLGGTMGLYLGLSVVPALLTAFLTGTLFGLVVIAREGAQARKKAVPFGIFLAIGGLAGVLAGPELIDLYESNFLG